MTQSGKSQILVARIGGAHGIRGEVRAQVFTADPLSVSDYGPLVDGDGRSFRVLHAKPAKSVFILKIEGVSDRDAAEALNGVDLFIDRSRLPEDALDEDEFYQDDLIGLTAFDHDGSSHGKVVAVHDFGAGVVLELQPDAGRTVMIPFSEAAVPEIDMANGRLRVEPLAAGLVDADAPHSEHGATSKGPGSRRRRPPRAEPS
nr:ribosome maturation factor RimM [Pararhizobium haloflavum]